MNMKSVPIASFRSHACCHPAERQKLFLAGGGGSSSRDEAAAASVGQMREVSAYQVCKNNNMLNMNRDMGILMQTRRVSVLAVTAIPLILHLTTLKLPHNICSDAVLM